MITKSDHPKEENTRVASGTGLQLDEQSIRPEELSMPTLMRELELQKRPAWILCRLMNILENKRQKKGLGWSRIWNKADMNIFETHVLHPNEDQICMGRIRNLLEDHFPSFPEPARRFVNELLEDPKLMAFVFYHNRQTEGDQFEGFTLSFGRRVPGDKTKRDRVDIVLEDLRVDGKVDGKPDRLRIYVCPWSDYQNDKAHYCYQLNTFDEGMASIAETYQSQVDYFHQWKLVPARQWDHWSSRFIQYFGPRSFIPQGTRFY